MKAISIIRFATIMTVAFFATIFIFGEEQDENLGKWFLHFLFDKTLGVVLFLSCIAMFNKWRKTDSLFNYFYHLADEE